MTNEIIEEVETIYDDVKDKIEGSSAVTVIESDAKAIGASALAYIKSNGLTDLYTIAMSVLTGVASGTPYTTVLSTVVSQGKAAGISIAKGAEGIVVAQAQADLIAAGTLASPSTGVIVASTPVATPAPTPTTAPAA